MEKCFGIEIQWLTLVLAQRQAMSVLPQEPVGLEAKQVVAHAVWTSKSGDVVSMMPAEANQPPIEH